MKENKLIKVAICQGVPASGKTTWAKEFITAHQNKGNFDWVRINRDDLRNSTGVNYHFKNEDFITKLEHQAIVNAIESGLNIISDNTNLNPTHLTAIKQVILDTAQRLDLEVDIEVCHFKISFEEAVERDLKRDNPVGKKVLKSFFHKYYPDFMNKIDSRILQEIKATLPLPECIICDIDGTISLMNGRNPFKGEDCVTDLPNMSVINLLQSIKELNNWYNSEHIVEPKMTTKIILFSGRNGESEEQTKQWLLENQVPYDELYMREIGNQEKDSDLKKRLYKNLY